MSKRGSRKLSASQYPNESIPLINIGDQNCTFKRRHSSYCHTTMTRLQEHSQLCSQTRGLLKWVSWTSSTHLDMKLGGEQKRTYLPLTCSAELSLHHLVTVISRTKWAGERTEKSSELELSGRGRGGHKSSHLPSSLKEKWVHHICIWVLYLISATSTIPECYTVFQLKKTRKTKSVYSWCLNTAVTRHNTADAGNLNI